MFPPALASVLRDRCSSIDGCLTGVADEAIVHLLTTIFFAGLESYEGEHNPVRVALLGKSTLNFVIPDEAEFGGPGVYQWKVLPFESPRPFEISELVKLSVAGASAGIYSAVHVLDDNTLAITGLAREGVNFDFDPFLKIVSPKPGCLSIRSGRHLLLGYEHGVILTSGGNVVFSVGPIRRWLETIARAAGLENPDLPDYFDAVQSLVGEMAAHGRGGILIVSHDEVPRGVESAPYRMRLDSSVTSLLRLARRISRAADSPLSPHSRPGTHRSPPVANGASDVSFRYLLRNAFRVEANRIIEELGALTAIDGAVLLNQQLALVAFGVILPVGRPTSVVEADDPEGLRYRSIDLGSRGTRHRASAAYAAHHPGSIVFVASEDGQISCLLRQSSHQPVVLWRLRPDDMRVR
jgi:hypothetical protein